MTDFKIGDRVFARVRSYPFWPAKVEQIPDSKKKRYTVIFYFTLQLGYIDAKSIEPFNDDTIAKFKQLCKTKNFFREALEDALIDEAQEGVVLRSDETKLLPLYEEPVAKKKKFVVPPEPEKRSVTGNEREQVVSNDQAREPLQTEPKLEPILMPAPEDLFTLHLDLVKSLHHRYPDHEKALKTMNRIQTFLDWPSLIKTVPDLVENIYKISNYSRNKQVQLKAIHLYNKMKWTLFCNREIDFIEKQFPV